MTDSFTRLLKRRDVETRVGLGTSTIYRMMAQGKFPKPRKLGGTCVRWVEGEIDAWIADLGEAEYREDAA